MSTYFVLYSINLYDRIADKEIIVESDCSGKELYEQILKTVENTTEYLFTIKNIVCLDNVTQMPAENPLRVTHPSRPSDPNAAASDTPVWVPLRRSWTDDEVAKLKEKVVPEGRSIKTAHSIAHRLHIPFNRIRRRQTPQKEKVALLKDDIVKELLSTYKIRATARKFGVAYTSVRNIAVELGLVA